MLVDLATFDRERRPPRLRSADRGHAAGRVAVRRTARAEQGAARRGQGVRRVPPRCYDPDARAAARRGRSSSVRYRARAARLRRALGLGGRRAHARAACPTACSRRTIATADVFVCASDHEGFCVPLLEAMHHRVPIVAYAAAAVPETLGDGGSLPPDKDAGGGGRRCARSSWTMPRCGRSWSRAGEARLLDFDLVQHERNVRRGRRLGDRRRGVRAIHQFVPTLEPGRRVGKPHPRGAATASRGSASKARSTPQTVAPRDGRSGRTRSRSSPAARATRSCTTSPIGSVARRPLALTRPSRSSSTITTSRRRSSSRAGSRPSSTASRGDGARWPRCAGVPRSASPTPSSTEPRSPTHGYRPTAVAPILLDLRGSTARSTSVCWPSSSRGSRREAPTGCSWAASLRTSASTTSSRRSRPTARSTTRTHGCASSAALPPSRYVARAAALRRASSGSSDCVTLTGAVSPGDARGVLPRGRRVRRACREHEGFCVPLLEVDALSVSRSWPSRRPRCPRRWPTPGSAFPTSHRALVAAAVDRALSDDELAGSARRGRRAAPARLHARAQPRPLPRSDGAGAVVKLAFVTPRYGADVIGGPSSARGCSPSGWPQSTAGRSRSSRRAHVTRGRGRTTTRRAALSSRA